MVEAVQGNTSSRNPAFQKNEKELKIKEKLKNEMHIEYKHTEDKHKKKELKDVTAVDIVKQ